MQSYVVVISIDEGNEFVKLGDGTIFTPDTIGRKYFNELIDTLHLCDYVQYETRRTGNGDNVVVPLSVFRSRIVVI